MQVKGGFISAQSDFLAVVIIDVCRFGKSLLGNILAICKKVKYAKEPQGRILWPLVAPANNIDKRFANRWFCSGVK